MLRKALLTRKQKSTSSHYVSLQMTHSSVPTPAPTPSTFTQTAVKLCLLLMNRFIFDPTHSVFVMESLRGTRVVFSSGDGGWQEVLVAPLKASVGAAASLQIPDIIKRIPPSHLYAAVVHACSSVYRRIKRQRRLLLFFFFRCGTKGTVVPETGSGKKKKWEGKGGKDEG